MATIKKNIVANLIAKIWSAAIAILLVPQYIKYLGIESYGLIGFYATLIGSMSVLDLGLSLTLNRELAKYKSENRSVKDIRDLTFSLERIYWLIGISICFSIVALSGFIANHWVNAERLSLFTVKKSIILMGSVIAFQWPISFYSGGLTGLEKQILNNRITVIMNTLRAGGVILILKYVSASLQAFFLWQAAISFIYVMIMRWNLWNYLPVYLQKPVFSKDQLKIVWRFVAGLTGIGFVTLFIGQIDKIVLSKILPLSQFGYYTLAFSIATSVSLIVGSISSTFFPRFSSLIAGNNTDELKRLYHQACRLISILIFPFCLVLLFFTKDILMIWTKNETTAENTYRMAQILIVGSIFNALIIMPYNLLLAHGRTRFIMYQNTIAAVVLVPMLFLWTHLYGAIGATFVWIIVNAGYVFISQPLIHRNILKNELKRWYINDTLLPMFPSLLLVLLIKISLQFFFPHFQITLVVIGLIFFTAFAVSSMNIAEIRGQLKRGIIKIFKNDR